jgi:SAM-dependent methyltransferase
MSRTSGRRKTDLERQLRDVAYYDAHWSRQLASGDGAGMSLHSLLVPTDEELARQDLGHLLVTMWEWLGDLHGARVLELGCGSGDYTVMLARRGAQVTCIDISAAAGDFVRARAAANRVAGSVTFLRMAAEALAFSPASFDLVVGFGVLHHIDIEVAAPELRRVLRPGGRAIFREPLGTNPLLAFARDHLPYHAKARSPNEMPLTYEHIAALGAHFRAVRVREMYLLSMLGRAIGREATWMPLWHWDEWLLQHYPALRRFCRYVLVEYTS